ncbi:sorting nexin-25-like [Ixodes scapularis]|uniref:sorting nexin-25-like n=1 Tax=Ixodes scapularis TaxID=6945 RepID=UPI001C387EC9|nr:sorting nexin-25-like [Ixodes scapularis]
MTTARLKLVIKGSVAVCLTAALAHYWGHLDSVGVALMYGGMVSLGVLLGCRSVLCSDERFPVVLKAHKGRKLLEQLFQEKLKEHSRLDSAEKTRHVVFSRDVDARLNEILDLCIRDFVLPWYRQLVPDHQCFCMLLRSEMWRVLRNIKERCHKMDDVKLLTDHMVRRLQSHLRAARLASGRSGEKRPFPLSPFLETPEKELGHLRQVSDFLLALLLPSEYALCISVRHLLREILACLVLQPTVEMVADPDYLNQKLVSYLQWLQVENEKHSRTYAYAETWEDFIFVIETCTDVQDLKRMRFNIVSEIMQATTANNLKKARGISEDKQCEPQSTAKGDLLKSRNLSKYIKQLTYAKALCEKQLRLVGGVDWAPATEEQESLPGRKVFAFSVLMESPVCRDYLARFLQGEELGRSLLTFWQDVEEMWLSNKDEWHQRGNEIYQRYIKRPWPGVRLSKGVLRGIEAFIMANKGPEAFRQAQQEVYQAIEERYYHSFLVSEAYHNMILETQRLNLDLGSSREEERETPQAEERAPLPSGLPHPPTVTECCSLAQERLSRLEARMDEKRRALQALHATLDSDPKMVQTLEKEMESMRGQCDRLAAYIERLQAWIQGLGLWTASIHSSQLVKDSNLKLVPYFAILVSVPDSSRSGWVVTKTIPDFHCLQQRLLPVCPELKQQALPSANKPRFRNYNQPFLDKTQPILQRFLDFVMKEERLNRSDALYSFFSQGPDPLEQDLPAAKKGFPFPLLQFFRNLSGPTLFDSNEEDDDLFFSDRDLREDKKDDVAVPLYALADELFELQGVFNWLRRALISFVQTSYGKTINRQLREWVSWAVSEPVQLHLLEQLRDSLWPGGKLAPAMQPRSEQEQSAARKQAKLLLLANLPDILNVVGQQNARKGAAKAFDILQNVRLNKQLFYDLFGAFLLEFAPELRPH